jgi:hypothetical protein
MRLRFRVFVSDEVQQAPRLSDLSAPPSPASYDSEVEITRPFCSFYNTRVGAGKEKDGGESERERERARGGAD